MFKKFSQVTPRFQVSVTCLAVNRTMGHSFVKQSQSSDFHMLMSPSTAVHF